MKKAYVILFLIVILLLCACTPRAEDPQVSGGTTIPTDTSDVATQEPTEPPTDPVKPPPVKQEDLIIAPTVTGDTISFSPIPANVEIATRKEGAALPILEGFQFEGFTDIVVPELHAWAYRTVKADPEEYMERARNAAETLWGSYVTQKKSDTSIILVPENEAYPGSISVEHSLCTIELSYWRRLPEGIASVALVDEDTAVALAREMAAVFGLDTIAAAAPDVTRQPYEQGEGRKFDSLRIEWPFVLDGITMKQYGGIGLAVDVVGDAVVNFSLNVPVLEAVTEEPPAHFLSPEEALYCINYSRGFADALEARVPGRCGFYLAEEPESAGLYWSYMTTCTFTTESDLYVPAYRFTFKEDGTIDGYPVVRRQTVWVDAYTGKLEFESNVDDDRSSPYLFKDYDPYASFRTRGN